MNEENSKRDHQVLVHLNDEEYERLKQRCKDSGYSKSKYLRHCFNLPTDPFFQKMKRAKLNRITMLLFSCEQLMKRNCSDEVIHELKPVFTKGIDAIRELTKGVDQNGFYKDALSE